ncbi:MAG: hypothetical protein ABI036_12855 [Fibrobacteria bacterium]
MKIEGLDTTKIHELYMSGEFEDAIAWLEESRKAGWLATHGDSIFAYKHLGVMYAAKYETMERGKQFMYQLLTIEPTVRIMDMFASDMIYMIFHNVQTEYEIQHARVNDSATLHAKQADTSKSKTKTQISKKSAWPYWTGGALLLAAGAGVAAYLIFDESPSEGTHYKGGL